jgi:hypothetical protein
VTLRESRVTVCFLFRCERGGVGGVGGGANRGGAVREPVPPGDTPGSDFPTHGQLSAAQGSPTNCLNFGIRLIQHFLTPQFCNLMDRRWSLTAHFLVLHHPSSEYHHGDASPAISLTDSSIRLHQVARLSVAAYAKVHAHTADTNRRQVSLRRCRCEALVETSTPVRKGLHVICRGAE